MPPLGKMVDLERSPPPSPAQWTVAPGWTGASSSSSSAAVAAAGVPAPCSICLEPVQAVGRATAKLHCGHEFHLDCIGSAFNVKGAMQCPNCRKIENGRWLYANGHDPPALDYDTNWIEGAINAMVPDPPYGFHWCPINSDGSTNLASMFEGLPEAEPSQTPLYHMSGDHSGAGSSSHAYPQLSLRDLRLPAHVPSSASSGAEGASFQHNPTRLEGHATPAPSNAQAFHASESRNLDCEHQYSRLSASSILNHAMASFARAPQGFDTSSQQRSRPYIVHHYPLVYRLTPYNGSNLGAPLGSVPTAMTDTRGHDHGARGHLFQQQAMHSHMQSNPFPPTTRRVRPRATAIASLIATSPPSETSLDTGRPHEFAPPATMNPAALNMSFSSDGEGPSRPPVDRSYGWGQEGFAGHPVAGEPPQWWRTFMSSLQNQSQNVNHNQNQNHARGRLTRRSAAGGELMPQGNPENGYPPSPPQRRSPSQ